MRGLFAHGEQGGLGDAQLVRQLSRFVVRAGELRAQVLQRSCLSRLLFLGLCEVALSELDALMPCLGLVGERRLERVEALQFADRDLHGRARVFEGRLRRVVGLAQRLDPVVGLCNLVRQQARFPFVLLRVRRLFFRDPGGAAELFVQVVELRDGVCDLLDEQPALHLAKRRPDLLVLPRGLGLALERPALRLDLLQDVVDASEVVVGRLQAAQRLDAAVAVPHHPRGLVNPVAPLLWRGSQSLVNLLLPHDRIPCAAHARVREKVVDVAKTAGAAVDPVVALAAAVQLACHGDLWRVNRQRAVLVVEDQGHFAVAELSAPVGP